VPPLAATMPERKITYRLILQTTLQEDPEVECTIPNCLITWKKCSKSVGNKWSGNLLLANFGSMEKTL
jgi:hypothetical protein